MNSYWRYPGVTCCALLALAGSAQAAGDADAHLSEDWNGARIRLADRGITLDLGYRGEAAHNFSGGTRRLTRYADQFTAGATADRSRGVSSTLR